MSLIAIQLSLLSTQAVVTGDWEQAVLFDSIEIEIEQVVIDCDPAISAINSSSCESSLVTGD